MKNLIIRICLWVLALLGWEAPAAEITTAPAPEVVSVDVACDKCGQLEARLSNCSKSLGDQKAVGDQIVSEMSALSATLTTTEQERDFYRNIVSMHNEFHLPDTIAPYRPEIRALCEQEKVLAHGSVDILGDSWLKFRRVSTQIKKAHPELRNREIFQAVLIVYEEMEADVPA